MYEKELAVMALLVVWHFFVGPLIFPSLELGYWETVRVLIYLSLFISTAVLLASVLIWSIEVLTGADIW